MAYGPNSDCQLDEAKTTSVSVSPGFGAYFRFSCPAADETVVCVYRTDQGAVKVAERRLSGAAFEPWSSGGHRGEGPVIYMITAWRKKTQGGGGPSWRQITVRSVLNSRHELGAPAGAAGEGDAEDVLVASVDVAPQV